MVVSSARMPRSRAPNGSERDEFIAGASRSRARPIRRGSSRARDAQPLTSIRSVHFAIGSADRSNHRPACSTAELKTAQKVSNSSRARLGRALAHRSPGGRSPSPPRAERRTRDRLVARFLRLVSMIGPIVGKHAHQQSSKRIYRGRVSVGRARPFFLGIPSHVAAR